MFVLQVAQPQMSVRKMMFNCYVATPRSSCLVDVPLFVWKLHISLSVNISLYDLASVTMFKSLLETLDPHVHETLPTDLEVPDWQTQSQ